MEHFTREVPGLEGRQTIEPGEDHSRHIKTASGTLIPFNKDLGHNDGAPRVVVHLDGHQDGGLDLNSFSPAVVQAAWQDANSKLGMQRTPEHMEHVWAFLRRHQQTMVEQPSPGLVKAAAAKPSQPTVKRKVMRPPQAMAQATAAAPATPRVQLSELFQIPGLAVKAVKPDKLVTFNFHLLGKQRARYHWVTTNRHSGSLILSLTFDRRFDLLDPYLPPTMEPTERVHLVIEEDGGERSHDYVVFGGYFVVELGTFLIVNYVVAEDSAEEGQLHDMQGDVELQ